jgi:hypothetical protein
MRRTSSMTSDGRQDAGAFVGRDLAKASESRRGASEERFPTSRAAASRAISDGAAASPVTYLLERIATATVRASGAKSVFASPARRSTGRRTVASVLLTAGTATAATHLPSTFFSEIDESMEREVARSVGGVRDIRVQLRVYVRFSGDLVGRRVAAHSSDGQDAPRRASEGGGRADAYERRIS